LVSLPGGLIKDDARRHRYVQGLDGPPKRDTGEPVTTLTDQAMNTLAFPAENERARYRIIDLQIGV
jgi:hypothetical protein